MQPMDIQPGDRGMYRQSRLQNRRSGYGVVIALVAAFAVVGWLWFLFASGFWDIQIVETATLVTLDRGEVLRELDRTLNDRVWRPWKPNNLLMLDSQKLSTQLRERLFADDVIVDKTYPNVLRLKIKERQRSVVLMSNEQYVNVDTSGVVTGDTVDESLQASRDRIAARAFADEIHLPVIVMNTADPLAPGFQVAQPDKVRRWLDVSRALVLAGLKVRFMKIEAPESSLARFVSERGYDIYLDLSQPVPGQIATYLDYMKTKPDESQIKAYMDVRVAGKVFIK